MITWMQRHKKWLIITIWISTIAFVGAGFVGWGQYSYGDKAGAVAKVGKVEITMGELQKVYSRLYSQYNQMFQGDFDEEKAKEFGLQKQALEQLVQQSLMLNLAHSYELEITDAELLEKITTQEYFFKDAKFDKETYKQVLSQNKLSTKEYEAGLTKELLIEKTLNLLPVTTSENELSVLNTLVNIADKINYKVLSRDSIKVELSDATLKPFWKTQSQSFMNEVSYDVTYLLQEEILETYTDATLSEYYSENKNHFKESDGKVMSQKSAKDLIIKELNDEATKDKALRSYIAYKKGKLEDDIKLNFATISNSKNIFTPEVLEEVSKLSPLSPYMKPLMINGIYHTFKLAKVNQATQKSYEEAKKEVTALFIDKRRQEKIYELANKSIAHFKGTTTDFITVSSVSSLTDLSKEETKEFLTKLFTSSKKRAYISLNSGKIVLYYILEQKLLDNTNKNLANTIEKLKNSMFSKALIKTLQNKYQTEIFIQGL